MPIVINLEVPGADRAMNKFDELIQKMQGLNAEYKEVGKGFSSGAGARAASAARSHTGIYTRLAEARERLNTAIAQGTELEVKDARAAVFAAQKRVEAHERRVRAAESGIPEWISTARVAIGPNGRMQLMPLLNRMMDAGLSTGEHSGILNFANKSGGVGQGFAASLPGLLRVGAVAAGITLSATAIKAAADRFADSMRPFSATHWAGGGTARQTGAAVALAGALGMDGGSMGDRANSLSQRLLQGGYGASYLRSRGITGAGWWRANQMGTYLRAVDELRNIKSDEEAIRVARDLGMSEELRVRDLSEGTYRTLRRSQSAAASRSARQQAAEYEANKAILGSTATSAWVSLANPVMKAMNAATGIPTAWLDIIQGNDVGNNLKKLWNSAVTLTDFIMPGPGIMPKFREGDRGREGRETTRAIQELTRALKDTTEAINMGSRSSQAVPLAWRNQMLEQALHHQAMALGSWTV